jgi:hypothetical protein
VPVSRFVRSETARRFIFRIDCVNTTWRFRIAVVLLLALIAVASKGFWTARIGHALVCADQVAPVDALVIENFDPDYLLFERAESLVRDGYAHRIFVPVTASADGTPSRVGEAIAEVMAHIARLQRPEFIPIREEEPISLHAAVQIRAVLARERVHSVIIVTSGFRSRRSDLVNRTVLARVGIAASCIPVFGTQTPDTWATTWHGMQTVAEQFMKLQYYRWYVMPSYAWRGDTWASS